MFSQIVTAARGLLSRPESNPPEEGESTSIPYREKPGSGAVEMVTATRRTNFADRAVDGEPSTSKNNSSSVNGKSKSQTSTPNTPESGQVSRKRKKPAATNDDETPGKRKRVQVEITLEADPDASRRKSRQGQNGDERGEKQKLSHVRFGSEEPPSIVNEDSETVEKDQNYSEHGEESDDGEAPEAVSNKAQLKELKDAERKREQAKQRQEQSQRDKRREREKLLQFQAALSKSRQNLTPDEAVDGAQKPKHDEILSESSATLQGSDIKTTRPSMIQSLPILLPDEILNAEPSIRPPTPPPENSRHMAKPTSRKLRFLDEVQKPPKDARIGNTSIKVLDEMSHYNSRTGANPSLAPKSSKASKNVRDSWLLGNRNKDVSNGLRRTTGGSSGFVRK